jgi:RNA polymerase sigma factor (TIGR02999 family)
MASELPGPRADASADLTRLVRDAAGDQQAAAQLLTLVYDQLRKLAQQKMNSERPDHTLQATALVHEAYLRLLGAPNADWQGRAHFFAAAAEAMRRILIERARQRGGPRRGGQLLRVELDEALDHRATPERQVVLLDEALSELERHDAQAACLVKLRYFVGMGHQEAADAMGLGRRSADRLWALARAWLYEQVRDG